MSVPCPGVGWEPNPGHQPDHTKGRRVLIVLRNGDRPKDAKQDSSTPGWASDTTRWTRRGAGVRDFDIEWFKVL